MCLGFGSFGTKLATTQSNTFGGFNSTFSNLGQRTYFSILNSPILNMQFVIYSSTAEFSVWPASEPHATAAAATTTATGRPCCHSCYECQLHWRREGCYSLKVEPYPSAVGNWKRSRNAYFSCLLFKKDHCFI